MKIASFAQDSGLQTICFFFQASNSAFFFAAFATGEGNGAKLRRLRGEKCTNNADCHSDADPCTSIHIKMHTAISRNPLLSARQAHPRAAEAEQSPHIHRWSNPIAAANPSLIDLAPSILANYNLKIPAAMKGKNIFQVE